MHEFFFFFIKNHFHLLHNNVVREATRSLYVTISINEATCNIILLIFFLLIHFRLVFWGGFWSRKRIFFQIGKQIKYCWGETLKIHLQNVSNSNFKNAFLMIITWPFVIRHLIFFTLQCVYVIHCTLFTYPNHWSKFI